MANKQYISIIRLFNHCGISAGDDFNLARTKKQLQAEFGIARSGFIEVEGYTYSKHDVFEEIEQADFPRRLVFHRQIWKSKQILQWLEKAEVNFATIKEEFDPFWSDCAFDEFFSPYFVGPFHYYLRTSLTDNRLEDAGKLLAYEEFLQANEREEAFRPIRAFLEETMRLLRNLNGENYKIMRPKINHWIDQNWYIFFNNLPNEFYEEKNEIITKFINLGVAIQKTYRRDCKALSHQLIRLTETPESLRSIIVSNHAVYIGDSGVSRSNWKVIAWFVFILVMIGRINSPDGCGGKKEYDFKEFSPPPGYRLDSSGKLLFDSIRIINDSTIRTIPDRKFN